MIDFTFETFKPINDRVRTFVDYYYLDIKPHNTVHAFECFPHFNNTISLYKSHHRLKNGNVIFDQSASALQIFTPVREKVLHVKQIGEVQRIVIVFNPLGIQQFYKNLSFTTLITDHDFFTAEEISELFATTDPLKLANLLDGFLLERFQGFEHQILEKSVQHIFQDYEAFSVSTLSKQLNISRQHLNRLFKSHLGVSVKKFHEIVVFRKSMHHKLFSSFNDNLTALAYTFNYSDQSHFIKAYKNLTAHSPRSFFNNGTKLGKEDTFWHLQS